MKINNFQGDLTDVTAKKEGLLDRNDVVEAVSRSAHPENSTCFSDKTGLVVFNSIPKRAYLILRKRPPMHSCECFRSIHSCSDILIVRTVFNEHKLYSG